MSRLILDGSRRLFEQFGYAKTTVHDIAAATSMSPANLYRYFRNKQAIGEAVVADYIAEQARLTEAALAAADGPEARLRALITTSVAFLVAHLQENPKLVELAAMVFETEEGRALIERLTAEEHGVIEAMIRDGVARGDFAVADPAASARALMNATKFFRTPDAVLREGLTTVERDLAETLDLLMAGLRAGAQPAA